MTPTPAVPVSEAIAAPSPEDVKRSVREAYNQAAPRYARFIAPTFVPIARRILALARVNTDDLHVDLATGTGLVPAVADDRRVINCIAPWRAAMDFSSSMLRVAREAARSTRFVQGELDRLPFRTASIDLLTLSLALHHLPTPRHALPELRRVLRPRGRLVLAAWSDERSDLWRAFDAWFERAGLGRVGSGRPADLSIDTSERLTAVLREVGGFRHVEVTCERPPILFPTLDDFWEWRISFPETYRAIAAVEPTRLPALRDACLRKLSPLVGAGEIRADQAVLFAVARP
ncbi:MAG: methyltransferase domain-containing protein [Chloroflexota bacterium]